MVSTCCTVRGAVIECGFPGHVGFGSRYPSHTDVMLSKPFVLTVPSPWKVKTALSNSYSQPTNKLQLITHLKKIISSWLPMSTKLKCVCPNLKTANGHLQYFKVVNLVHVLGLPKIHVAEEINTGTWLPNSLKDHPNPSKNNMTNITWTFLNTLEDCSKTSKGFWTVLKIAEDSRTFHFGHYQRWALHALFVITSCT